MGTIAIDQWTNPGLWSEAELADAVIVHRMITRRWAAGRGIGGALLAHADGFAIDAGCRWVRLDAWTSNHGLHRYYEHAGFRHVRTVSDHPSRSTALFEREVSLSAAQRGALAPGSRLTPLSAGGMTWMSPSPTPRGRGAMWTSSRRIDPRADLVAQHTTWYTSGHETQDMLSAQPQRSADHWTGGGALATANNQFRDARENTESPTHPGYCLTREELAELVNTYIYDHHENKMAEASANYIGQVENGRIRWPGKLYREAFRAIFGVSTDSDLGFVNARSRRAAVKLDNVKRQEFIHDATALGVGALAGLEPLATLLEALGDSEPTPIPARIGATDIDQIQDATRVFDSWSRAYGGAVVREPAMGQLRWSASLLKATCPDRLRPELFSGVGALANTVGYMALDADVHGEAHRVFRFALACAEKAQDWPLRAYILSSMAEQAVWTGQPDDGLTLAEQALVRSDRLTAAGRSLLHNDRARALAKMRRVDEALTAIGVADEHFAHFTPDNEPPCMAFYNTARHAQLTGRPLVDLAILGRDPGEATDRLTAAATGHTEGYTRSRAICLTKLATLTMVTGDLIQAAAIGHAALDIAGTIRSRRAAEELRELAHYAAAHQHLDEVAHLRHRIATLVGTGSP